MKNLILTILILFQGTFIFSQLSIGPKTGLVISNLAQDDGYYYGASVIDSKPYCGFQAGVSIIIETYKTFRPQLEIFYFQEGNNYDVGYYYGANDYDFYNIQQNRRYLRSNIVFNIGRAWAKYPNFRLYGTPGLSIGYLIGYNTEPEYQPKNSQNYKRINYSDLYIANLAIFIGFGAGYKFGPGWFEFSPRLQVSLVPYRYEPLEGRDSPCFSSNVSFNIGYTFLIEKH